jgi:hypothetical protein
VQLDRDLPELPVLVAYLPQLGFNGPAFHGTIDEAISRPETGGYDVQVTPRQSSKTPSSTFSK